MTNKSDSKIAQDTYQGYLDKTVLSKNKNLSRYIRFESEYAFRFHFNRCSDWGDIVVDFGGRIGEKTRKIKNVTVVEIDSHARKWMKMHGIRCTDSLERFADNSIDTIYCSHVLEHLENPIEYLRIFNKKLKIGGRLILVLPAELQMPEPKKELIDENGHLQTWNLRHIMTSLKRAKFSLKEWQLYILPFIDLCEKILGTQYISYLEFLYKINRIRLIRNLSFIIHWMIKPLLFLLRMAMVMDIRIVAKKEGG